MREANSHSPFAMRWLVHKDLPRRLMARTVLAAAALALALPGAAGAADKFRPVIQEPHYGDALFHFYQEHYFSSVTGLIVSQHFERVAQHADEAEVLRGGLLLSYGLHREAGEIFARLIEKGAPPAVQDRAWFYLAKIRYQRGFLSEASEALARIGQNLPADLQEDHALLQGNVLMTSGAYAEAAKMLASLPKDHSAGPYIRYNLGVALIKNGETADGTAMLELVGRGKAADEETRSLRDRANLALGFAALRQQRSDLAKTALERVRLSGMLANRALLGFGWADAEAKDPRRALVAWTELAGREVSDAAVLEARLAVPYAYSELGAFGQAMDGFNAALEKFDDEDNALDESIAAIRSGALLADLLQSNPGEEMGWFWNIRVLPDLPHSGHLAQVLAQHDFQEAFKNYRDLNFLAKNLQTWLDKLVAFEDMLANRRKAYADRLPQVRTQAAEAGLGDLQRRRDALAAQLERAEVDADVAAFADAKQADMLERIASARQTIVGNAGDASLADATEQLRRVAGALTWQLTQEFPGRVWDTRKAVQAVDAGLADARQREAALARAQVEEPARFDRFGQRIAELASRIRAMVPRVAALKAEQKGQVQELAVAELVRQKEHLAEYVTQARFAVAQLQDRAHIAQESDHAKQP